MNIADALEQLRVQAHADRDFRAKLLETKNSRDPLQSFCEIAGKYGWEISPMELVMYGEETYASIRRSTNGGGENSPLLEWSDDFYELLMAELSQLDG